MRRRSPLFVLLQLGLLAGCYPRADLTRPLPSELVPAPRQPATRLVVVLPGRSDDIRALRRAGIADAVQSAWPDADVLLSGLALNVYMEGRAVERLQREIITPARAGKAYRQTWLLGASLGGMGAIMYRRTHPDEIAGMVLMAPYLGEPPLLEEISAAGGLSRWQPGDGPEQAGPDGFQRGLWRHLQGWQSDPALVRHVWVGHGDADYLRAAIPLLAPVLPDGHVQVRPGGHAWSVWTPLAGDILRRAGPATLD